MTSQAATFGTNKFLAGIGVFIAAFSLFAYIQATPGLADPDAVYHIKMAQLLANGVFRTFPNLPYTLFSKYFTDQHFLYHVLLIPFVSWLDPFAGAKWAQAIFGALTATVFYWVLRRLRVSWPLLFTAALCLSAPFLFRASLIKVPALSILVLM